MTEQPEWECIANIGDMNPIDHGGKFVLVDKTGRYAPEMEVLERMEHLKNTWQVWRFPMERCTYVNGVLSDNSYHPELAAWFADDIESTASTMDTDAHTLIRQLCSEDPRERAEGYYCLWTCHGADNFDSYPLELTRREAKARYSDEPYNVEV